MNVPPKLQLGDEIRVIAPSCAKSSLSEEAIRKAVMELTRLGYRVTWGSNTHLIDEYECSPIAARIADLHDAFLDKNVKAILAVRGGFYANQLLDYIDWDIIRNNPKIFCGFSDITVLQNAMLAKADLVTYSGPNLSYIGKSGVLDYTLDSFQKCLSLEAPFAVSPSELYQDFGVVEGFTQVPNSGWFVLSPGRAEAEIVGGNLCTLNLLQGTQYMPQLSQKILFLEDDMTSAFKDFDRNFQSLMHIPGFEQVKGIVFGRFQQESGITRQMLQHLVDLRPSLNAIPILANVDFGHTEPKITFPIGGQARIVVGQDTETSSLVITVH